jgi:branched-chain amino acid transport system substrate-binding protein
MTLAPNRRALLAGLATIIIAVLAAGCGSSGAHSTLVVAAAAPFTGPDADFGPTAMAGCVPAVNLINRAGGVLGHKFKCLPVDTRGDPADAVPAVEKLLATQSGLVAIAGPTSDETTALAPVINASRVPFFTSSGQSILDHAPYPYFYRLIPADDVAGYAMALWGHLRHYTRAAAIFGNDVGSQGTVPTLLRGLQKLGGPQIVINETLSLDQTSYRTEVQRMLAANPQVIFTEIDAQTAATFFSELAAVHGLIPVIGADPTLDPTWFKTVAKVVGAARLSKLFTAENPVGATSGSAWSLYSTDLVKDGNLIPDPSGYTTDGVAQSRYNGINLVALAMIATHSTDPKVFNPDIVKLAASRPGAVPVYSFAEGKRALLAGKQIQYVGIGKGIFFNRYHNSPGQLEIDHFLPDASVAQVPGSTQVTAQQINAISQ